MPGTTLIQLVSEQAMPNLLAAMAIHPGRIVHLCTDTPAVREGSASLCRAYKASGLHAEIEEERLSPMPSMREVNNVVGRLLREDDKAVLNFTGGTKLMSIGAFAAALSCKRPSFYVDTVGNAFIDGHTAPGIDALFPNGDTSISQIKHALSVPLVAIANGVERVGGGKAWEPFRPLASFLLENEKAATDAQAWAAKTLQSEPFDFMARKAWILQLYAQPLPDKLLSIADPAIAAELFERRDDGLFLHGRWKKPIESFEPGPDPKAFKNPMVVKAFRSCHEEAIFPLQFLQGTWWEVAVAAYLAQRGDCRDIRWSVQAGARNSDSTDMEEDILGIANGLNLLYVSCKLGGDRSKLSRFLEETAASAKRVGGSFAHKVLAVCLRPKPYQWRQLTGRAKELHVEIITREDLLAASAPPVEPNAPAPSEPDSPNP